MEQVSGIGMLMSFMHILLLLSSHRSVCISERAGKKLYSKMGYMCWDILNHNFPSVCFSYYYTIFLGPKRRRKREILALVHIHVEPELIEGYFTDSVL